MPFSSVAHVSALNPSLMSMEATLFIFSGGGGVGLGDRHQRRRGFVGEMISEDRGHERG